MFLTYINPLSRNYKGEYVYEFIFSDNIEIEYGQDWTASPASGGELTPPPLHEIKKVGLIETSAICLDLGIFSDMFSMEDCVENILALGWENETPDDMPRLVFHYGETFDSVKNKFYSRDIIMKIIETE
jgi:hypothetical protein